MTELEEFKKIGMMINESYINALKEKQNLKITTTTYGWLFNGITIALPFSSLTIEEKKEFELFAKTLEVGKIW